MLVYGQYNSVSKVKKNIVKCLLNEEKNDASSAILHNNSTKKLVSFSFCGYGRSANKNLILLGGNKNDFCTVNTSSAGVRLSCFLADDRYIPACESSVIRSSDASGVRYRWFRWSSFRTERFRRVYRLQPSGYHTGVPFCMVRASGCADRSNLRSSSVRKRS